MVGKFILGIRMLSFVILMSNVVAGQDSFKINSPDGKLSAQIYYDNLLTNKDSLGFLAVYKQQKKIQEIKLTALAGTSYTEQQKQLVFEDFNFDGQTDMEIFNGDNGCYGEASYDIYLFDSLENQFRLEEPMSLLTSENCGLFTVDKKRNRLISFNKMGPDYTVETEYIISGFNKLEKVKESEMKGDVASGSTKYTTRTLIKGKWQVETKIEK